MGEEPEVFANAGGVDGEEFLQRLGGEVAFPLTLPPTIKFRLALTSHVECKHMGYRC